MRGRSSFAPTSTTPRAILRTTAGGAGAQPPATVVPGAVVAVVAPLFPEPPHAGSASTAAAAIAAAAYVLTATARTSRGSSRSARRGEGASRKAHHLDLLAKQPHRDEQVLPLLDVAPKILLGVHDQQRRLDLARIGRRRV